MIFEQIRSVDGTGTLSYLIADESTHKAAVIDPNIEDLGRIKKTLMTQGLSLIHVIDTHTHVDHVSAAGELKKYFGATLIMQAKTRDKWKVVEEGDKFGIGEILRANASFEVDTYVNDGDKINIGSVTMNVLHTPGHTDNHLALLCSGMLFTGDLLLIGQAGRSDLPGGSPEDQFDSLMNKVLTLPDDTQIYPGHDYENNTYVLLGSERTSNPFLKKRTKEEYVEFVESFFPPLSESVGGSKVTLQCGATRVIDSPVGVRIISSEELSVQLQNDPKPFLLDVREPFELTAFGAIPGVLNISVRQLAARVHELPENREIEIVAVCQTGSRSIEAAHFLSKSGYMNVSNLQGGTSAWRMSGNNVVFPALHQEVGSK